MATTRGKESPPPDAPSDERDKPDAASGGLPDIVRKALAAGFSGFFVTEEAVRKALGDTLPKEWSDFAVEQSARTRAEFLERLSYEIGRSIENVDLAAVFAQLLEGRTLEVNATVRLSEVEGSSALRVELENPKPKPGPKPKRKDEREK
ncbi:MAG: hypothetical protein OEP95_11850 [Myxococcales bacterium]|nr:hypothetical protein [Myxococcales bacterium]